MLKPIAFVFLVMIFTFFASNNVFAQTNVAVILATKGDVQIFRAPETSPTGPFLTYDGKKYAYEKAKIGKKVRSNEIVHSGDDGRTKLVYPNGDQLVVGPGTSMVMPSEITDSTKKSESVLLNLFYGKVRSVISKDGPRNHLRINTPTAVSGVRGTDFFISHNLTSGTDLTVMRGEVVLKKRAEDAKVVSVKKGFTVNSDKTNEPEIKEATKEQLVQIQADSTLKATPQEMAELPADVRTEMKDLSEKAKQIILTDIKKDDPNLYNQLQKQKNIDEEAVNSVVVSKLFQSAPSTSKKKPTREEIDAIGGDVYDKYFKTPPAEKK